MKRWAMPRLVVYDVMDDATRIQPSLLAIDIL